MNIKSLIRKLFTTKETANPPTVFQLNYDQIAEAYAKHIGTATLSNDEQMAITMAYEHPYFHLLADFSLGFKVIGLEQRHLVANVSKYNDAKRELNRVFGSQFISQENGRMKVVLTPKP